MNADDYISASEIGEYLYCRRAWWYRRAGAESANQEVTEEGTLEHDALAGRVEGMERSRRRGRQLLILGFALLIVFALLRVLAGQP